MARLEEVFKKSGVPTHTFVEPAEYQRMFVALRSRGRGVVVEGPSGIGKTSCVRRALEALDMSENCTFLSARRQGDIQIIAELPVMEDSGVVVIDDFHRLDLGVKNSITDYLKLLADEEREDTKLVLIGINQAGQALIDYAPDLTGRVEVIPIGRTNVERIADLIQLGEEALNCEILISDEIAMEALGSFAIAQVLCHEACLQAQVHETCSTEAPHQVGVSLPSTRESVLAELHPRFFPVCRDFATGNRIRREGRAPYLHLLLWLSETDDGSLDTRDALNQHDKLKGSVGQVIAKGHLTTLIEGNEQISEIIHFDPQTNLLVSEDPKFLYFSRYMIWANFARQIGYRSIEFRNRYDFALSFAGEQRDFARQIANQLQEREVSVFYDENEQHRFLANDVEEYLAPIYRSESGYVVALLSQEYPKKIWTKFESDNFKHRFGENAVIPIWFADSPPGVFDQSSSYGGLTFYPNKDRDEQVSKIVDILCERLRADREQEVTE